AQAKGLEMLANSEESINELFDNILKNDKNTTGCSLNKTMSKIDNEIWITVPNNTNVAEAAHVQSNHCEKI
ncbi:2227_t:CDS:2, partial [Diversispora eburnea]